MAARVLRSEALPMPACFVCVFICCIKTYKRAQNVCEKRLASLFSYRCSFAKDEVNVVVAGKYNKTSYAHREHSTWKNKY